MKTKSQYKLDIRNNAARAGQWEKAVRKKLESMLNVNSRHSLPGGNPNPQGPGFMSGVTPNDVQVAEYIASIGGNPYTRKREQAEQGLRNLKASRSNPTTGVTKAATKAVSKSFANSAASKPNAAVAATQKAQAEAQRDEGKAQLQAFLDDAQAQYDAANKANEERYSDILGRLEGSRERNLERVENYGVAAGADLEERFANNLGDIRANLSARGLGNSTIFSAFEARNARDLAREQQRLSEQVDSRTAEYDQRLTGDIAGFMERRDDVAPDFNAIAALAQQYGLSNYGEGYDYKGPEEEVVQSGYQGPGGSAKIIENPSAPQPQQMMAPPAQVPQPTVPVYKYQQPRGVSPRAAQRLAANVQSQMPNYGALNGFVSNGLGFVNDPARAPYQGAYS